jgi:glutamyl-tRNA reductase
MSLYTLGLNHTTAPLEVRERVAFSPDALSDALRDLVSPTFTRSSRTRL